MNSVITEIVIFTRLYPKQQPATKMDIECWVYSLVLETMGALYFFMTPQNYRCIPNAFLWAPSIIEE